MTSRNFAAAPPGEGGGGGGGVTSVNGKTGVVVLNAATVGADASGTAAGAVAAHKTETDPHGDRAYADVGDGLRLAKASNLADLGSASTARSNLGLGGAATLSVGTSSSTVAAGDDSRIVGAQQRSTLTTKGDLYVATGSATVTRVGVGSDGQVLAADSAKTAGVGWVTPSSGGGGGVKVVEAYITTGEVTLPGTSGAWQALSGFEISIAAAAGDYVDTSVRALRSHSSTGFLDLAVIVGSTLVRYLATGSGSPAAEGDPGWYRDSGFVTASGPRGFTVTSGDLDSGKVRLVVAVKAAEAGTLYASADYPFYWRLINYGAPG